MSHIKALIFDLGNVIFDISFERTFQSWAKHSGKTPAEIQSAFVFDELYEQFERDDIPAPEFRRTLSGRLGISLSDELFDEGWCDLYRDVYPGIDDLLLRLKDDYQIVAFTNTNKIHETVWKEKYRTTLQHFERVFSSCELKTRKPEEQAYRAVLDYLQMQPDEILFIDDNPDNTAGAEKIGIRSVLVSSPAQMVRDITSCLHLQK